MKSILRHTTHSAFIFLAAVWCLNISIQAQDITGTIVGTVRDASGAAVPGATVVITDSEKNNIVVRTLTANDEGEFSAPNLTSGVYQVAVEAANFKKSVKTEVKLEVGQRRLVDVELEAGSISETVTVEAEAVSVNLTTPTASTLINGDQVRELSINNRNFVQLVALAPGVSNDLADQVFVGTVNPDGQANTVNLAVNGARSSQNTFTVDGADVTDRGSNLTIQAYPSVDSIGEFRVLRSLYPAESGNSGGGQVNIVTRSGTADFRGSLFEFFRNEKLNANDFLSNQTAPVGRSTDGKALRRPFRYNNFGGTIGGPVYFVNLKPNADDGFIKRLDRTFFFFSAEYRRDVRFPTLTSTVPDANLRRGVFPIDVCLTYNAAGTACTETLTAGTPISAARLSPAALAYVTQIYGNVPLPNAPNVSPYTLIAADRNVANFRQEIVKIDHSFSDSLSAFYRFQNDSIPTVDSNALFNSGSGLPGVSVTETNSPGKTHTAQMTYAASSNMIFEGRYAYSYGAILSENVGLISNQRTTIPINLPFPNTRDRITSITGNGFSNIQGFGPYDNFSNKHKIGGSFTMIRGSHTLKFGADYSQYRKNENALVLDAVGPNQGSTIAFNAVLPTGVTNSTTNQNLQRFANFLLGNVQTFRQARFDYTADLRQSNFEAYGQDEWRVRRNLTLYYGVRYSLFGQARDENGRLSNFIPELYNAANAPFVTGAGNRVAGTGNGCNGLIVNTQNYQTAVNNCVPGQSPFGDKIASTPKTDFAPRVGLAYDPYGDGRTSIRLGYGIYHEQVLNGYALQIIGQNPPYQENVDFTNVRLDNPAGVAGTPLPLTALTVRAIQSDWKTPYMQHWSLDIQHQLTRNTLITGGFYGSKGTNLIGIIELNELRPGVARQSFCATGANFIGQTAPQTLVACQNQGAAVAAGAETNRLDQIRPYRGYRSITRLEPRFNSNYQSLQLSAQHRFGLGSQINAAYTFAKNFTDNQTDRSTAPQNSYDIRAEYGRAALDRRHVLTVNYIYELPFFDKQRGFLKAVLGGWQTSGIFTYNSGLPFTVTTSSFDPAGLGFISALVAGGRPNLLCDPNENAPNTQQQFFNTACFERNPSNLTTGISNTVGTAGRGIVNGPRTVRFDFTMQKNFRFTETMRLQLRGEAFNIFNTTNFRGLGTNVTLANFGQVISVRDPRTLQLGAKFYF